MIYKIYKVSLYPPVLCILIIVLTEIELYLLMGCENMQLVSILSNLSQPTKFCSYIIRDHLVLLNLQMTYIYIYKYIYIYIYIYIYHILSKLIIKLSMLIMFDFPPAINTLS